MLARLCALVHEVIHRLAHSVWVQIGGGCGPCRGAWMRVACGRCGVGGAGGGGQFLVKTGSKPYALGASSYQNSQFKGRTGRSGGMAAALCLFFGRCWQTQYWRGFGALVRVVVHSLAHSCGGQAGALACAPAGIADNARPGAAPWRCGHLGLGRRWRVLSPSLTSSF